MLTPKEEHRIQELLQQIVKKGVGNERRNSATGASRDTTCH